MKKSIFFQLILALTLLCVAAPLSSFAAVPEPVATVVAVRGTATAQGTSGAGRNLALKSPVFLNDVLKTDTNGQLQILFTDNSIISLGRGSEMKIAEYRWQAGQKDGALRTQIKEGAFRVMGGALAKDAPQNFKTETPTATIGIRGSMYAGVTTADFLSVIFQGGKGIDLYNEHGTVAITVPGFGSQVFLNAPPERPHRFSVQELNNINNRLNGQGGPHSGPPAPSPSTSSALLTDTAPFAPPPPALPPVNELPTAPTNLLAPSTNAVINTAFIGAYAGGIQGTYTYNSATTPFTGTYIMVADFRSTPSIYGVMNTNLNNMIPPYGDVFQNYSMTNVTFNATPTSNSFSATIQGEGPVGKLTGTFYGPAAQVVKGSFSGTDPFVPVQFKGTFGGNRIAVPPQ